jgi:CubicO group peptidase (beta-lactamase class C family)
VVVARHGHDVLRGWWSPYSAQVPQLLYSLSKSFTATAVGFALAEGRFGLDDRVIDFFPERSPSTVSANLAALRVRHLLTMSVGHASDSTPVITHQQDWVRAFLALPIEQPPGSAFLYDSGASYMLSAIIQKRTGATLDAYLRHRLFDPLAMDAANWAVCPLGISTGGWGLKITSDSLARFGQLYLQKGQWRGRQLLPTGWVEEATRAHIHQPLTPTQPGQDASTLLATSDWHQGYGYQFWRCRHNAYRGDGAFGQFCVVMPEQQAVVAITSCTADMQGLLELVWKHLLPNLADRPLAENRPARDRLESTVAALTLAGPAGAPTSPMAAQILGRRYLFEANSLGASGATIRCDGTVCRFELETAQGPVSIRVGMGRWIEGFASIPGAPPELSELVGLTRNSPGPARVAAFGAWPDSNHLEMHWRYPETPHYDLVTCSFEEDRVRIRFTNSITKMASFHVDNRPELIGRLAA